MLRWHLIQLDFVLESEFSTAMESHEDQISDEQITMLMSMGFCDIDAIRKALALSKNDLNDAVAILTGEDTRSKSCIMNIYSYFWFS